MIETPEPVKIIRLALKRGDDVRLGVNAFGGEEDPTHEMVHLQVRNNDKGSVLLATADELRELTDFKSKFETWAVTFGRDHGRVECSSHFEDQRGLNGFRGGHIQVGGSSANDYSIDRQMLRLSAGTEGPVIEDTSRHGVWLLPPGLELPTLRIYVPTSAHPVTVKTELNELSSRKRSFAALARAAIKPRG